MGAVRVRRVPSGREDTVQFGGRRIRVIDLIRLLNLNREAVVVTKDGRVLPDDAYVKNGDNLVIYSVVSGG